MVPVAPEKMDFSRCNQFLQSPSPTLGLANGLYMFHTGFIYNINVSEMLYAKHLPGKPPALLERLDPSQVRKVHRIVAQSRAIPWHIREVHIADVCIHVPSIHRIDGLGELMATCLINAASINPGIRQAIFLGLQACKMYLSEAGLYLKLRQR